MKNANPELEHKLKKYKRGTSMVDIKKRKKKAEESNE
jgi:hypothetical protein